MHSDGDEVHVSEEEASGGSKEGVVRWVLIIGTLLAIIALSAIWITGAAFRSDPDADNASVSDKVQADQSRQGDVPMTPSASAPSPTVENGLTVVPNAQDSSAPTGSANPSTAD
jgi:hypothetical protein